MSEGVSRGALRLGWPAMLVAALVLAPFLDKAFTIDDSIFMIEARHAVSDPLHPTSLPVHWEGRIQRLSSVLPTGPVMAWLLTPAVLLGGAEWVAHAVQLALLVLGIWATVALALRLGATPAAARAAGLLLATTPAVLGMAGTAMPDVAAMAIGVSGFERLVAWRDGRSAAAALGAGLLLGLAPLARSHLLLLLPIGAILLVADPLSPSSWLRAERGRFIPLALAAVVTGAVSFLTRDRAGVDGLAAVAASLSSPRFVPTNALAFALHWSLALPLAIPLLILGWRERVSRPWIFVAVTAAAYAYLALAERRSGAQLLLAVGAGASCAALVGILGDALRARDPVRIALGAWLLVPLAALPYPHLPAKYLVPCAPAVALLVGSALAARPTLGRALLAATAAGGIALSVAILRADAALAEVGRSAARALIRPQVAAGRRVWYSGYWSFQWYAEQAGARPFTVDPPFPAPGDLVATTDSTSYIAADEMGELTHLGRIEDRRPGGRVMSHEDGAGFFSNAWGYLPWAWGAGVIDGVDLWEVAPLERWPEPGAAGTRGYRSNPTTTSTGPSPQTQGQ